MYGINVYMSPRVRGNPYQLLLAEALEKRGVTTSIVNRPRLMHALLARRSHDLIHLHWPEIIIGSNTRGPGADLRTLAKAAHLLTVLSIARIRQIRIVWTVHNLTPHEARHPRFDRAINRCIARLAETVLTHSKHAADQAREAFGGPDVKIAFHGNYIGYYPPARRTRLETRRSLGISSDSHVILAFGFIRPYKRLPELIAAFRRIDDPRLRLLVAGLPLTPTIRLEVERLAATDPRIVLSLQRVPDEAVCELHDAADVGVFAYRDIFSSGALMLSLSCGLPVIVPANTTATELGDAPAIQSYEPNGLSEALAGSFPTTGDDRRSAILTAKHYGWDAMAASVLGKTSR